MNVRSGRRGDGYFDVTLRQQRPTITWPVTAVSRGPGASQIDRPASRAGGGPDVRPRQRHSARHSRSRPGPYLRHKGFRHRLHFSIDISDAHHCRCGPGAAARAASIKRPIITCREPGPPGRPNEVSWIDAMVNGCTPSTCRGGCNKDLSGIVVDGFESRRRHRHNIHLSAKGHLVGQRGAFTGVATDTYKGSFYMLPEKLSSGSRLGALEAIGIFIEGMILAPKPEAWLLLPGSGAFGLETFWLGGGAATLALRYFGWGQRVAAGLWRL